MEHISIEDFHQLVDEKGSKNVNIIDVRTPEKFASAHIDGAMGLDNVFDAIVNVIGE